MLTSPRWVSECGAFAGGGNSLSPCCIETKVLSYNCLLQFCTVYLAGKGVLRCVCVCSACVLSPPLLQVLTPADDVHHINKHNFKVPFVCGCRDLGEALRRIAEGAAMIRTKGEAGTGNVVEAVRHTRSVTGAIRQLQTLDDDELYVYAKEIRAPVDLVRKTKHLGRCISSPCANFVPQAVPANQQPLAIHISGSWSCFSHNSFPHRPYKTFHLHLCMHSMQLTGCFNQDKQAYISQTSQSACC